MQGHYKPWMEEDRILWKKRIGYLAYQGAALLVGRKRLVTVYENAVRSVKESGTLYEQSALPVSYYFDRAHYEEAAMYPFEDTVFPGPKDYDAVLSSLYGDYMTLPPEDKRENRHQIGTLDFGE